MGVEPPPSRWTFPPASTADEHGVVGVGADLEPGTLLAAYRQGLFPMPAHRHGPMAWWSPDPRGIIPLEALRVTRSLRQSTKRYRTTVDTDFTAVVDACRNPRRPGAWITPAIRSAYEELHRLGWAHSVETWDADGHLAGGLYGIGIGAFFAGESMFHTGRDASKVALVHLVRLLRDAGAELLDVQWSTDHLRSLGAIDLPRSEYLARLGRAIARPIDPFA